MNDLHGLQVVALGGGHGLSRALAALRLLDMRPTAVVTVADDGGSSGRLRRDLGIIAPGDLRMALLTLARNDGLAGLLAHRFARGELDGHSLGNLALVALAEQTGGDWVAALDAAAVLLDCAGRVLPSTTEPVGLRARVAGREVDGQVRVATATEGVERVELQPAGPAACDAAVDAVAAAEAIVLGPGSLFTSIIPNLLVPALGAAVREARARVIYVANIRTQPGETSGLDAEGHVRALLDHLPGLVLDAVLLHDGPPFAAPGDPLGTDLPPGLAATVASADLAATASDGRRLAVHDPERLASSLATLLPRAGVPGAVR